MTRSSGRSSKRSTISDVAKLAGVSPSTVSNVLNGRLSAMTEETLQRINDAIKSLDYQPSSLARSLKTQHTATIGIILAEVESPLFLNSLHIIEPLARAAGYSLLMSVCSSLQDERQALHILLNKQVEGIIFFSTSALVKETHLLELVDADTPVVLVNRASRLAGLYQVNWDDEGDTRAVTNYLIDLGHKHIGYLAGPITRRSTTDRLKGFRAALESHDLPYRSEYVRSGDYTGLPQDWIRATRELLALAPRPSAIIASNDTVAATVMRALQKDGVRVPDDVSLVGHDDQPFAELLTPALTTMREPVMQSGKQAIQMLLGHLQGKPPRVRHVTIPGKLIVRESTSRPNLSGCLHSG